MEAGKTESILSKLTNITQTEMKKTITFLSMTLLLSMSMNAAIKSGTGEYLTHENLKYEILDSDNPEVGITVQEDECPSEIIIPSSIIVEGEEGDNITYSVTQINSEAFKGNVTLRYIQFPSSITEIGDQAFEGCESLDLEELPDNLLSIGVNAFRGCKSVKRIKLPETTQTLGEACFSEMSNLKRAILFSEVKELPNNLFENDIELEEVYLPQGLEKIGDSVFQGAILLEELQFPSTLKEIGRTIFFCGLGLNHLILPESVIKIEEDAFNWTRLLSADLGNIEEIPDKAFYQCDELREVKFPSNLKSIGELAFGFCAPNSPQPMLDIVLPSTLEEIKENAFYRATMTYLEIGDLVNELPTGSCGRPKMLKLGSGINKIGENAIDFLDLKIFYINAPEPPVFEGEVTRFDWGEIERLPLTEEEKSQIILVVKDEEAKAKYEMSEPWNDFHIVVMNDDLVYVTIEDDETLEETLDSQHINSGSIINLKISGKINEEDFYFMREKMGSLMNLDMGEADIEIIPYAAFQDRLSLKSVVLPGNITRIEDYAFSGCANMEIESLPESIEHIGSNAFFSCAKLNIYKMPDALKEVGNSAFYDCASLKSVTFGENLENLETGAFHTCINLEYVDLSKTKIKVLPNQGFIHAFALNTLLLPETLETIDYEAISVAGLTSLDLPSSLKTIEDSGISRTKLRTLTFGENLIELKENALANNERLLTVNLPASIEYISESAFSGDKKISAISCYSETAPEATSETFADVDTSKCLLSVPANSLDSYLEAEGWNLFCNIENTLEVDIPEDVEITTIPEEDYQDLLEEFEMAQKLTGNSGEENEGEEGEEGESDEKDIIQTLSTRAGDSNPSENTKSELLNGNSFCRLLNGTVMATEKNDKSLGHRIFIFTPNNEPITSVKINDVEMVDQLDGNSIVIPGNSVGNLSINGGNDTSKSASLEIQNQSNNVYDITGRCVIINASTEQINLLHKGLYIINGKKVLVK